MHPLKQRVDRDGGATYGQLTIHRDADRYRIATDGPGEPCTDPEEVAQWSRFDPRGRYRPLTGARSLRGGLDIRCEAWDAVARVIETIYPLALTHDEQHAAGTLRVVELDDVLARQSGRYESARSLDESGRSLVRDILCSDCVRAPVWAGEAPAAEEIACPEPCSVLVALIREAVVWGQEHATPTEPDPGVDYAAFETPGNELRETYLRSRRQTVADG